MKYFLIVLTLGLGFSSVAWSIDEVQFNVTRRQLDNTKTRYKHSRSELKTIVYKVEVASHTSQDLKNLTVKYNIFFSDTHFANTEKPVIRPIVAKYQIPALPPHKSIEFETDTIALETATWDIDYRYKAGVNQAKDKIIGFWFKVFDAQGKQLGEYYEPPALPKEQTWFESPP